MKKSSSHLIHVTLFAGILVVVLGVFAFFLYIFLAKTVNEATQIQKEMAETRQQIANAQSLENFLRDTERERSHIDEYFIDSEEETVSFLEYIESVGEQASVETQLQVDTVDREDGSNAQALKLSISSRGSYQNLFTFVQVLERLPVKLVFSDVRMRRVGLLAPQEGDPEWLLEASIVVKSFDAAHNSDEL